MFVISDNLSVYVYNDGFNRVMEEVFKNKGEISF